MFIQRRKHKRFFVSGEAAYGVSSGPSSGEVVSIGGGGLLIVSDLIPPVGAELEVRFSIHGYNSEIRAKVRVVRTADGSWGVAFTDEPRGLAELLLWLESEILSGLLTPRA